jgi:23S rRNA pseudouridine2605 synthase
MEERLQKILSAAGIASRRTAEGYITEGRVTVNGVVATLGTRADLDRDEICLDGKPVRPAETLVYLMLNKPRGYVTTLDDEKGRKTAAQLVADCGQRVYPVGRLDMDSEGLLLFTNDGELTNQLTHPRHQVEKEYQVKVKGNWKKALPILNGPMELDGVPLAAAQVELVEGKGEIAKLTFVIHQGKNRQIRRMCAQAGVQVLRLKRVREGNLRLGKLASGSWRYLTSEEVDGLKKV